MLKRYADSLTHFSLGALIAVVMLCFDTHSLVILWGLYLFGYAREQAQVGMAFRDFANSIKRYEHLEDKAWLDRAWQSPPPHPWKPWQWSAHTHAEALAWAFGGLAALALL